MRLMVSNTESRTLQFLHESRPSGLDSYYHFKDGFVPSYSDVERAAIENFHTLRRAQELDIRIREADIETRQNEV